MRALVLLLLVGCTYDPVAAHCGSARRVAEAQASAAYPKTAVTAAGGFARQMQINEAGSFAYYECMARHS